MTADVSGSLFDLYALGTLGVAAGSILIVRALRRRSRRAWWRS